MTEFFERENISYQNPEQGGQNSNSSTPIITKIQPRRCRRDISQRNCSNCGTSSTSTWRTLESKIVCNACKCFYRKHGYSRPIEMRKDVISTRNRNKSRSSFPHESVFTISTASTETEPPACEEWEAATSFCYLLQSYFEQ